MLSIYSPPPFALTEDADPEGRRGTGPRRREPWIHGRKMTKHFILLSLLVVEILLFVSLERKPFAWTGDLATDSGHLLAYLGDYFSNLIVQAGPTLFLAFGMTILLMTAGIDLSVGSMVALTACVMSRFAEGSSFWVLALPSGALVALLLGSLNGLLVARLSMPPIIATLGTMIFYRGLCYVVMADRELAPFLAVPGYEYLGSFPVVAGGVAMLYGVGGWCFYRSRLRRELLMLGGNRVAARYAGIPIGRRLLGAYALSGAMAFLAAVAFTARNGSVSGSVLAGLELQVIVAVVLGGTRVEGGSGTLLGSLLGVLIIAVLEEGLRGAALWGQGYLPFDIDHLRYLFLGGLLILGVWLNTRAPE